MKKEILSLLGCSGSIALTLIAGNPASANPSVPPERELVFTAPNGEVTAAIEDELPDFDCSCGGESAALWSDETGEQAIASFGCDCAGCRRIALSLAQEQQPL